ncbi:winged helix-turn-helix transcriptional regulator [Candidatus Micrarchaeota archaeon]|nr:winged helix-turn-helix transcriptional regulator [Candidatus Micrarchaeota archaeon]
MPDDKKEKQRIVGRAGFCTIFFSALANRLRVRILQELAIRSLSVSELAKTLNKERTLISHNLSRLTKADLVRCKKVSNRRIYSINEVIVPQIFLLLDSIVCSQCSLRETCNQLKMRQLTQPKEIMRPACIACR